MPLLDEKFNSLNGNIFKVGSMISADPHLNVVSGGLWQLPGEPWRAVEAAAGAEWSTHSTIPQRVGTVEYDCH